MQIEPRGLVRLSCPLGLQGAIAGPLPGFLAAHPQLRVQCIATNRRVDLIHEGVDVAIRVRERLDTDADLQVKQIGISRRILVASPDLLAKAGVPMSPSDLANFPVLHQEEQSGGTWQNGRTGVSLLILVVDDEADVETLFRQQFRRDLRAGRFTMEFAQSAPTALQCISDAGDASLILILSDINMPGMSGLELLPKAKALRPDVPVIMITAYGDAETKRKALERGAEALLTKPIDFTLLRSEIDTRIEKAA